MAFDIFLVVIPGLEQALEAEVREKGFQLKGRESGGVTITGDWPDVWRANLELRGASRVLARIGAFRASHLAQLDKRARAFPWSNVLRKDVPFTVEATCRKSKIYHSGAAAERIAKAITEELGAPVSAVAEVVIKARIERDLCTLSLDTSGGLLHKRGSKQAMAKAPLRETMAALLLRQCGFRGTEPVLDPMCGSGTFVIEAAEWLHDLKPGRARHFAFEHLASFQEAVWQQVKASPGTPISAGTQCHGSDRDAGAVAASRANAARAGVADIAHFERKPVADMTPPDGPAGLVMVNPPYGLRIGNKAPLRDLYATLGHVLKQRFTGWRVGLVTPDADLARATGLPFTGKPLAVLHGGLRVSLWRTDPLPPPSRTG